MVLVLVREIETIAAETGTIATGMTLEIETGGGAGPERGAGPEAETGGQSQPENTTVGGRGR